MARMIPELSDERLAELEVNDDGKRRAEVITYRALRDQLPARVVILYAAGLLRQPRKQPPRDGECDFVLFDPEAGILVIEVKGGRIAFEPRTGRWTSSNRQGTHDIHDPFAQAKSQKHEILRYLHEPPRSLPGRLMAGHAVLFPDVAQLDPLIGLDRPVAIMGGRQHLGRLATWIEAVMAFWRRDDSAAIPLGAAGMALIEERFIRPREVRPLVAAELEEEAVKLNHLTEAQTQILGFLDLRRRAAIVGGAGTGKTQIAVEQARQLASAGRRTLLLCFNTPLGAHLKAVVQGHHRDLQAMTFHDLCEWRIRDVKRQMRKDCLAEARGAYPGADETHVLRPYALALSAGYASNVRYDAIVVDEGQDFKDEYWFPLEFLLADPKESLLYIYFDDNQSLYQKTAHFPIGDESTFRLPTNCRNTRKIHELAYRYYQGQPPKFSGVEGAATECLTAASRPAQARKIREVVHHLVVKERVRPDEIAVLVAGAQKEQHYTELLQHSLAPFDWAKQMHRQRGKVLLESVERYKGLEASIIFLWGLETIPADKYRELLYVGISRAKHRLYLVGADAACRAIQSTV